MRRDEPNQESSLTIRLFGGMTIQDGRGANYLPRSRKTRAVVAILALTAPRPSQRSQLTALLWSQRENEQARASLRQAVHELQETFGTEWSQIVVAERHTLAMNLRDVRVDALSTTEASAPRSELLTLFQEGFLEDLRGLDPAFDDWLGRERRRFVGLARLAAEALFREHLTPPETIATARALLRVDPAHDGAWRALIKAHIDASDRAAARLACDQWREAMGLTPDQPPPAELEPGDLPPVQRHPPARRS